MVAHNDLRHSSAPIFPTRSEQEGSADLPFVTVAELAAIPEGKGLRVVLDPTSGAPIPEAERHEQEGLAVGLYRSGDQVYAMEDACPHAGFPLSRGSFENCVIVCDAHGWPFDVRTGFDPANADGFPIPCFSTRVVGDQVEVDLTVRTNDPRKRRRS
jgi:nitrite reductase (NADH) small subunit/3-phenylpropionate/trans-cinnamate dioxygenase ferredoxin subunit